MVRANEAGDGWIPWINSSMVTGKVNDAVLVYFRCFGKVTRHAEAANIAVRSLRAVFEASGRVSLGVKLFGASNTIAIIENFLYEFRVCLRAS
jgi:hypothetical protein